MAIVTKRGRIFLIGINEIQMKWFRVGVSRYITPRIAEGDIPAFLQGTQLVSNCWMKPTQIIPLSVAGNVARFKEIVECLRCVTHWCWPRVCGPTSLASISLRQNSHVTLPLPGSEKSPKFGLNLPPQ